MYDMGMDTIDADQLSEADPDHLVCIGCGLSYINGHPDADELPDLGDVVICVNTDEWFGMVTNVGSFQDCAACGDYSGDFYPVFDKQHAYA